MKLKKMCPALIITAAMSLAAAGTVFAAVVKGDVNGDGSVTVADAVTLAQYLVGSSELTAAEAADFNDDGRLNAVDLTLLKRKLLGIQATEPETPVSDELYVTQITFGADSVTLKNAADAVVDAAKAVNVTVENGTYVTITQPTSDGTTDFGELNIDGECADGQIKVDVSKETYPNGQVTLNLRGLTLSNPSDSPVYVSQIADECVIAVKKDTVNTISDGTEYTNADGGQGAVYSMDDLKFKGKGTLNVNGNAGDGIVSKDDLKIWNGSITVTAKDDGIRGKDSIRIGDPDATSYDELYLTVHSEQGDGLKSTNNTADSGKGYIRINGGTVKILADAGDGIQAEQAVEMNGGDINIYTYEGSNYTGSSTGGQQNPWGGRGGMMDGNANKTDISAKGIKAVGLVDESGKWQSAGTILMNGGTLTIDSSDDCIHCGGEMSLLGGKLTLATADDACHSDRIITIGDSTADDYADVQINVTKAYEGIEAAQIYQKSGSVVIKSTDDGYNAGGGADGSASGGRGGWGQGSTSASGLAYLLQFDGGFALVNVDNGDHDGYDSNGDIIINDGYVVTNGNEPFDCGDSGNKITVNGGVWVSNCSSGGMSMGGSEMNASVAVSGNAAAGERITVTDGSGNVIISFIAGKSVSQFKAGGEVPSGAAIYTGGTLSGETLFQTLNSEQTAAYGGTLTGGTQVTGSASSGGRNPFGGF